MVLFLLLDANPPNSTSPGHVHTCLAPGFQHCTAAAMLRSSSTLQRTHVS